MNVVILATKSCSHRKNLSRELDDIGVDYKIIYCDDEPEMVKKYNIRHSPNLIVNGEVVFRKQPSEEELKELFNR
jgi:glutaredoxin